ncbi:hypothetical protein [Diaphorobacter sp. J5-51]|uniref:hypothetical protein n=1 Tax=Diaphorobacter sp. J5-51 TaxID=680496 RepID=UPI0012F93A16|nr:hypothetical protein [Diaphorobacter sp. J5-51]
MAAVKCSDFCSVCLSSTLACFFAHVNEIRHVLHRLHSESVGWIAILLVMHTFKTARDALAAGFVLAEQRKVYGLHRECRILGVDTSGRIPVGLSFALRVEIPEDYTRNYLGVMSDRSFGQSVSVKLAQAGGGTMGGFSAASDMNKVVQMFHPDDLREAIDGAREWADRWFRYNPDAMERAILRRAEARSSRLSLET